MSTIPEWRCFHCDEVFTDEAAAREHFGISECETPGCKLNALEGGLLGIVRRQEEQLGAYRREDTESYREFYRLGADHHQALRREEEKGYARGLADGRVEAREECAKVADAMADEQQSTNEKYPDHAKAYETWRAAVLHYRNVADRIRNPRAAAEIQQPAEIKS